MDLRIAVGAVNLGAGFPGHVFGLLQKQLRPGQSIADCVTYHRHRTGGTDFAKGRLLSLLEGSPRPVALIAICIQPGPEVIAAYRAAGAPVIVVDEEDAGATTVATDNRALGSMAARHLLAMGRRSIAMVSGTTRQEGDYSAVRRQRGFREALQQAGVPFPGERLVEVTFYSRKDGEESLATLLDGPDRLDGIFCAAGDATATGMLATARERGMKVPDDLAIVSCDDLPIAAISDPPLTTLRQPLEKIAQEAFRLATEEAADILARPRQVLIQPTLVRRASA